MKTVAVDATKIRSLEKIMHKREPTEFDWKILSQMELDFGRTVFLRLISVAITDANTRVEKLQDAMTRNDLASVRTIAHQLSGILSQFGAILAAEAAQSTCSAPNNETLRRAAVLLETSVRSVALLQRRFLDVG